MAIRRRRREAPVSEHHGIDLAPMLDFTTNLLIFFIITTSFINRPGVKVHQPEAVTARAKPNGKLLIAIQPNGAVWMGGHEVSLRSIPAQIQRLHTQRPSDTVVILAARDSKAGVLAKVMTKVHQGGIDAIAVGAKKPGGNGG